MPFTVVLGLWVTEADRDDREYRLNISYCASWHYLCFYRLNFVRTLCAAPLGCIYSTQRSRHEVLCGIIGTYVAHTDC